MKNEFPSQSLCPLPLLIRRHAPTHPATQGTEKQGQTIKCCSALLNNKKKNLHWIVQHCTEGLLVGRSCNTCLSVNSPVCELAVNGLLLFPNTNKKVTARAAGIH